VSIRGKVRVAEGVDKPVEPTTSPHAVKSCGCYLCVSLCNKTGPDDVYRRWCCVIMGAEPCLCVTDILFGKGVL
jgi:hypothetical protein